jgi:hypothetical protein
LNAINSEGPWELHHSRVARRRNVMKGDGTTGRTIYAKINTRFKEVFRGSLGVFSVQPFFLDYISKQGVLQI